MAEREDKRIRRTKKLLRQALTRLMKEKDFGSITVTDVVREADINRGTFYAHYRDVYDLRERIEADMIADFRSMIAGLRPGGPEALQQVLSRAVDYLEENREIVIVRVQGSGGKGLSQKLIGVLEEYRLDVIQYRSVEDGYVSHFLATGVVGMLEKWITEPQPIPKNEMITLMSKIIAPLLPRTGQ